VLTKTKRLNPVSRVRHHFTNATYRAVWLQQVGAKSAVILMAPDWVIAAVNNLRICPRIVGSLVWHITVWFHAETMNTQINDSTLL